MRRGDLRSAMAHSSYTNLTSRRKIALKTSLWLVSMLFIVLVFHSAVINSLSFIDYAALKQNGFYLWAVLFLCIAWIFVKRTDIIEAIYGTRLELGWALGGVCLFGVSLIALYYVATSPVALAEGLFAILFGVVASFTLFFGKASKIPLMLLGLFGVAVFFPIVVEGVLSAPFSRATAVLSISALQLFGMPISLSGITVTLSSTAGYDILTKVDARCAGSDSLAIFLAVFGLMVIDRRPRVNVLIGLLVLGVIGTYLQNLVRLLLLFTAGYYYGSDALWAVHDYAAYVLFPLWFLIFSVIYLRYARQPAISSKKRAKSGEQMTRL